MKKNKIEKLSIEEIKQKLKEETTEYYHKKLNHKVSSLQNPIELRIKRKIIARMFTILQKKLKKVTLSI